MEDLARKGKLIGLTAAEILSLETQARFHAKEANKLNHRATICRSVLADQIASLQESNPLTDLPGQFTINGVLIDKTRGLDAIVVRKAEGHKNLITGNTCS